MPPQRFFGRYGQLEDIVTTAGADEENDIAADPPPASPTQSIPPSPFIPPFQLSCARSTCYKMELLPIPFVFIYIHEHIHLFIFTFRYARNILISLALSRIYTTADRFLTLRMIKILNVYAGFSSFSQFFLGFYSTTIILYLFCFHTSARFVKPKTHLYVPV